VSTHDRRGGRRRFPAGAVRTTRSGTYSVREAVKPSPDALSHEEAALAWATAVDAASERLGISHGEVIERVTDMVNEIGGVIDKYGVALGDSLTTAGLGGLFFLRLAWIGGAHGAETASLLYDLAAFTAAGMLAENECPPTVPTIQKENKS